MASDIGKIVFDDLTYLIEEWDQDITPNSIRVSSGILRRLLLENGKGVVREVWRNLGFPREPLIDFCSLDVLLEKYPPVPISDEVIDTIINTYFDKKDIPIRFLHQMLDNKSKILIAFAGGAKYKGYTFATPILSLTDKPLDVKPKQEVYPLPKYVNSVCAFVFGFPVNRSELIRYVVNKRGGVHIDRKRNFSKPQGKKFALLDIVSNYYKSKVIMEGMDLVNLELLSIGQSLINSPDIQKLREKLRN